MPTITFGPTAKDTVLNEFGYSINAYGEVVDENGELAESILGEPVLASEFAGFVEVDGEPVMVRDDFNEIVAAVEARRT